MQSVTLTTRTLPPTENQGKRVRVISANGTVADYPWDFAYDAPEMHEHAARKVAEMENPGEPVTVRRTGSDAMGYSFRAVTGA